MQVPLGTYTSEQWPEEDASSAAMRLGQPGEHKQKQTEGSVPDAKHDLLGDAASSKFSWRSVEGIQSAFDQRLQDVACAAVLMTAERVGPCHAQLAQQTAQDATCTAS